MVSLLVTIIKIKMMEINAIFLKSFSLVQDGLLNNACFSTVITNNFNSVFTVILSIKNYIR